jgi:hypothetical protein
MEPELRLGVERNEMMPLSPGASDLTGLISPDAA